MTPCENYSAGIIARTNGQPYATRNAAAQHMSAKGLNDTHEVIEHGDGYAIAPKQQQEERVKLKPGDYVSTEGMDEASYHKVAEAFMAAGADKGDYPDVEISLDQDIVPGFGWRPDRGLYHGQLGRDSSEWGYIRRHLTIAQVLNATNSQPADADGWIEWNGGECPVERGTLVDVRRRGHGNHYDVAGVYACGERWSHRNNYSDIIAYRLHKPEQMEREQPTMTVIDTLRIAKRERDKAKAALGQAEAVLAEAMDAVRTELGDGFELSEAGDVRDLPPEEWREGDLVECTTKSRGYITHGRTYRVEGFASDGDVKIFDNDGDEAEYRLSDFKFHSRPTE